MTDVKYIVKYLRGKQIFHQTILLLNVKVFKCLMIYGNVYLKLFYIHIAATANVHYKLHTLTKYNEVNVKKK